MGTEKKKVVVLGSTGSIGSSTLKVAAEHGDKIELLALATGSNVDALAKQVIETGVSHACIYDVEKLPRLRELVPSGVSVYAGEEGLRELACLAEADIILLAIVGTAGLLPCLDAIEAGKDIAVASKEILVMAGEVVMRRAKQHGVRILPVDSEHNAIFQCLEKNRPLKELRRLILTASGGPFRALPKEKLKSVTVEQALQHPTWSMGQKISIDSATLFNKGLEMIEARWLFGIDMQQIEAIVHPQSIVHSMVEYVDGSVLAQLSSTDMCFPIQYALTYPERFSSNLEYLDFTRLAKLEFEAPRYEDFPALRLAQWAGSAGGVLPAVMNAANEVAVSAFLEKKIGFLRIAELVELAMQWAEREEFFGGDSLSGLLEADQLTRNWMLRQFS